MDQKFLSALKYPSWVLALSLNLSVRTLIYFIPSGLHLKVNNHSIPLENDKFIEEKSCAPLHL